MEATLTTAQIAERLGITPSGVSRMVHRGKLTPAIKLPGIRGAFLFDEASVEALQEVTPNG